MSVRRISVSGLLQIRATQMPNINILDVIVKAFLLRWIHGEFRDLKKSAGCCKFSANQKGADGQQGHGVLDNAL
jgi:hypothetical protein